jgi:hypothetical protein
MMFCCVTNNGFETLKKQFPNSLFSITQVIKSSFKEYFDKRSEIFDFLQNYQSIIYIKYNNNNPDNFYATSKQDFENILPHHLTTYKFKFETSVQPFYITDENLVAILAIKYYDHLEITR